MALHGHWQNEQTGGGNTLYSDMAVLHQRERYEYTYLPQTLVKSLCFLQYNVLYYVLKCYIITFNE